VLAASLVQPVTTATNDPFVTCTAQGAPNSPADLQYERASDPWVSFGAGTPDKAKESTAYAISISFNQSPGKNGNTVGAAVSYNGGLTWQHAQSLQGDADTGVPLPVPDSNFQFFHDKESVTADPGRPGHAYAVWDVLIGPNMSVEAIYTPPRSPTSPSSQRRPIMESRGRRPELSTWRRRSIR
jgi:hypothetical protein